MARGEDTGAHPGRQVGRHVYEDSFSRNGELGVGGTPMVAAMHRGEGAYGPVTSHYYRPATQGPSVAGPPMETAAYVVGDYKPQRMSRPNPGGYTDDEIRNIMRDSGP
jgi:hypothetical protein